MAAVFPFQPYRYHERAGRLEDLVTQPYDKISPEMQARYLRLSPHNLVRIILGERLPDDNAAANVYTRAARHFCEWIDAGILQREQEPALFAYFQEFTEPDTGERLVRKGFIGLGAVEDYSGGVVHRHERTLSGPKQDRLELLRHTRAHFGQIFMLYPDPSGEIDSILDRVSRDAPLAALADEYKASHRLWKIAGPAVIARIQEQMAPKKLLIADGHHRYETALAFRNEHPELEDGRRVMMTFVNMHSPGLKILATHRLVSGVDAAGFREKAGRAFRIETLPDLDALRRAWREPHPALIRIGVAIGGEPGLLRLESVRRAGDLEVPFLHERILRDLLGIDEDAVREEQNVRYVRGAEAAVGEVRSGAADIAFLLEPTPIDDVARIAFSGGVMPQKSTDFYPKLLSGLTIYRLEK
jgi:uncharacterized protein (DUF1015 family)